MEHTEEFLKLAEAARARVTEISVAEAVERVENGAALIDVREDNEYAAGHARRDAHRARRDRARHRRQISRQKRDARFVLRRRFPFGARGGQSAKNGLSKRAFDAGRLDGLDRSGRANRKMKM